jgi:predicted DNA-binding protein
MLTLRLPREIENRLHAFAKRTGRSENFHARQAILQNLYNVENIHLVERETEAVRSGAAKAVSLDELMRRYGLTD